MISCILPNKVEDFKKALKDKDIKLSDLINLDHDQMVEKLTPHVGKDAEGVATLIESKLILKNRMLGMKNAISKLTKTGKYSPEKIAEAQQRLSEYRAAQQERIFSPKEHESFLGGMVEKELGFKAPKEVAKKVFDLTQAVSKAKENVDPELGTSVDYYNAKDSLEHYVDSQKPKNVVVQIAKDVALIGRNNFILGFATPLKTSTGQAENSAIDMLSRRLGTGEFKGQNADLKSHYFKKVQDFFAKTGRNILGMESLDDAHMLGYGKDAESFGEGAERIEKPSVGKFIGGVKESAKFLADKDVSIGEKALTTLNKTAEGSQYLAIKLEHQVPFTKFYQKAWLDMADLMSTKYAKEEGLKGDELKARAGEIFKDAIKIEPETEEGKALRKACQFQAGRVTSTNPNFFSHYALEMKNLLNRIVPIGEKEKFPLGDFLVPMAKIPATVISNMVENAGAGIPFGVRDMISGHQKIGSEDLETKLEGLNQYAQGVQRLARIAGSITLGAVLVNSIDKKNLRTDKWGNHFFKIATPFGDKWINTEYLSFMSASAGGFMEMKLGHAKQPQNIASEYVSGVGKSLSSLPGVNEVNNVVQEMKNSNLIQSIKRTVETELTARGIPQALRAIYKHAESMPWFGPNTRPADRIFFSTHGIESPEDVKQDKIEQKQEARERKRENKEF